MQAKVMTLGGEVYDLQVELSPTDTVAQLISVVIANISPVTASLDGLVGFEELKLYHKNKPLNEPSLTLQQAGLSNPLELVAVKPRPNASPSPETPLSIPKEIIDKATQHFPKPASFPAASRTRSFGRGGESSGRVWGLKLRALVSTLAHIGAALQNKEEPAEEADGAGDNGDALIVDSESLKQLVSMGFGEEPAKKALLLNRMSPILAMDWLLEAGETTLNAPLTQSEIEKIKRRKNTFKANPVSVAQLQAMGFNKHDIYVALRASRNDLESACTWLLGDRGSMVINLDDDDSSDMLPMDDPHVQALLANPKVQAGFSNPRVVAAFQSLAVNPANAQRYFSDSDVAPVLLAITQILQNESG